MISNSYHRNRSLCESAGLIRHFCNILLVGIIITSLATIDAQANPLSSQESLARRLTLRILAELEPFAPLDEIQETSHSLTPEPKTYVQVSSSSVNLRSGPTINAEVLVVAQLGERFEYIETHGEWYVVRLNDGQRGYISGHFSDLSAHGTARDEIESARQTLDPSLQAQVRETLSANQNVVSMLNRLAQAAEEVFYSKFGNQEPKAGDAEHSAAAISLKRIQKYNRVVSEKYNHLAALIGDTTPTDQDLPQWRKALRGTIRFGLGANNAETEVVGTGKSTRDVTRSELAVDLVTDLSPQDEVGLKLARSEEIRFVPATRTKAALNYTRKVNATTQLGAGLRLEKYKNDTNDLSDANNTEFSLRGAARPSRSLSVNSSFSLLGTSYPNNKAQNYNDTRFGLGAGGEATEKLRWRFSYSHITHTLDDDTVSDDNTQNRIEGKLDLKTGDRKQLSLTGYTGSYAFENSSDTRSYTRSGIRLTNRRRGSAGNSQATSLEFRTKKFDHAKDYNFTEIRGDYRKNRLGAPKQTQYMTLSTNYRNYKGEGSAATLDYLEARFDDKRQTSPGFFNEFSTYGQYFIENNGAERNAVLNLFTWLGFVVGERNTVKIGPHLAANTEIVTVDGTMDALGNELGVFASPNNTARFGFKGTAKVDAHPLKIRGSGRYEILKYYNIDNSSSPTRIELEGEGIYNINSQFDASVEFKYFATGSSDAGAVKSNEFDILFAVKYHLGGGR